MSSATITIGPGRFSYSWIFKPKKNDDGTEKFCTAFLWSKSDKKTTAKVNAAILAAIQADANGKRKLKGKTKGIKSPLNDGDIKREGDGAYEGMYYFNASSDTQPGCVDRDKQEILDPRDFKSGDYGYINITFYAFAEQGGGIAVWLNHVMKSKNGPALSGSAPTSDKAFEDIEIEDTDDEEEIKPVKKKKKPVKFDDDEEGSEFF